eukprot:1973933-Prymnesium_polylepis.1
MRAIHLDTVVYRLVKAAPPALTASPRAAEVRVVARAARTLQIAAAAVPAIGRDVAPGAVYAQDHVRLPAVRTRRKRRRYWERRRL